MATVKHNQLIYNHLSKVRADIGEHALRVSTCISTRYTPRLTTKDPDIV